MITSKDNQYLKLVRELTKKKFRDEYGLFLTEGKRLIDDLVKAGFVPHLLLYSEEFSDVAFLERICSVADQAFAVEKRLFHQLAETKNEQGVIGVFPQICPDFSGYTLAKNGFLLVLNKIADPGNLGALIRNGAAAGIDAVLLEEGSVDLYNPKTIRATMGTIAKIPVFQGLTFSEIRDFLVNQQVQTYLADMGDDICYHDLPVEAKVAVVFGNEGNGIDAGWRRLQLPRVSIPMENGVESLNVAMAAGIIAYDRYIRSRKT